MIDTFAKFEDLAAKAVEGADYRVVTKDTGASYLIAAIHGGNIEPFTSEIASAIAGEEYSLYLFEGIMSAGNSQLHIENRYFNEPRLMDMVRSAEVVLSIHGEKNKEEEFIMVGGLCGELVDKIIDHMIAISVEVRPFEGVRDPRNRENLCNKGTSGSGVEIEISRKLRDVLREDEGMLKLFTNAIRHAMKEYR